MKVQTLSILRGVPEFKLSDDQPEDSDATESDAESSFSSSRPSSLLFGVATTREISCFRILPISMV